MSFLSTMAVVLALATVQFFVCRAIDRQPWPEKSRKAVREAITFAALLGTPFLVVWLMGKSL